MKPAKTVNNVIYYVSKLKDLFWPKGNLAKICRETKTSDETSKFGEKYMGYHFAASEGNMMVLGLREIETKSAKDTLSTYNEILRDIDECSKSTRNEASMKILVHTVATMSDRAATEVKVNELLQQYRKEVLLMVVKEYDSMSAEEKGPLDNMYNFFCGPHSLVHIAEASLKALVQAEMGLFDGDVPRPSSSFLQSRNSSEPAACRLVRTACKAFARGADEKSGCHGPFSSFVKPVLKQYMMHSLPLTPYRGSRFNILFENASYMFFFHDQMILYLEGNNTNALLKAVLEDLKTPEFVAGCKALGLISCLITTPLWRMIEDKTINIVDMNGKSTKLKRDVVFEELLKPCADDDTGEIILKVVLPASLQ